MPAGRPNENRVTIKLHVTQETADSIRDAVDKTKRDKTKRDKTKRDKNTQGKIVDRLAKQLRKKKS
jgi:hypothetical protein